MSKTSTTLSSEQDTGEGRTRAIWDEMRATLTIKTADGQITELDAFEARHLDWAINNPDAFQKVCRMAERADVAQQVQNIQRMHRERWGVKF